MEDLFPHLNPDRTGTGVEILGGFTYVDAAGDIVGGVTDKSDEDQLESDLLQFCKLGGGVYIAAPVDTRSGEYRALHRVAAIAQHAVIDEALEALKLQVTGLAVNSPDEFTEAVYAAAEANEVASAKVVFADSEGEDEVAFHQPYRASKTHTVTWCADGAIEVDGTILRSTALMGCGHLLNEVLGGGVLTPAQVVGFIAQRMAIVGPEDLVGYGRAFGPGKEDQTNATLTASGRNFRANGVVGVVAVTRDGVSKARPDMVAAVATELHRLHPELPIFLHQQVKEMYVGAAAVAAFRAEVDGTNITLGGKSTKHARVDAGAFCLYTEDGTGELTRKAVIGNFEFSNDGSIYAPLSVMATLGGFLRESVRVAKDFAGMTPALIARYFDSEILVEEGDRIEPGTTVFTLGGVPQVWESKADYGIVRRVEDFASKTLVRTEVHIDAYFVGDAKMRGFGKGLICPSEAAGVTCTEKDAIVIGAAGIIKDSRAANERMTNVTRKAVTVTQKFCQRDWELLLAKHNPSEEADGSLVKDYPGLCRMVFDNTKRVVATTDDNAIVADIRFMVESSPVGQSVGSSSMTMPQLAWLSSLPAGDEWLQAEALAGIKRRTDALAYLHALAGQL